MNNQVNHSDLILSIIDHIVSKNMENMTELKHLKKLQDLGVSPDDAKSRMAYMQAQMEMSAAIMNILSPAYGGVRIILPQNLNLDNLINPTSDEKE